MNRRRLVLIALAVLLFAWLASGLFKLDLTRKGVMIRFGEIVGVVGPGNWHYNLPWPLGRVVKVDTTTTMNMSVGYRIVQDFRGKTPVPEETQFLLGDLNVMNIELLLHYVVEDASAYVKFMDPGPDDMSHRFILRSAGESVLTSGLARMSYEELFTRRAAFENRTMRQIQSLLDDYNTGFRVQSASLRVEPPPELAGAFTKAKNAEAAGMRDREQALTRANDILSQANARAYRIVSDASAEYNALVQRARGEAEAFQNEAESYARAPEETLRKYYLETLGRIYGRTNNILVNDNPDAPPVRVYLEK